MIHKLNYIFNISNIEVPLSIFKLTINVTIPAESSLNILRVSSEADSLEYNGECNPENIYSETGVECIIPGFGVVFNI